MAYDPQKIADQMWNNPVKNPKPANNTYYPTYRGADGLLHKGPAANVPNPVYNDPGQGYSSPGRPANNGIKATRGKPMKRGK